MIFYKKCLDSFFDGTLQNFLRLHQQCLISTSGDNFYSATLLTEKKTKSQKTFFQIQCKLRSDKNLNSKIQTVKYNPGVKVLFYF